MKEREISNYCVKKLIQNFNLLTTGTINSYYIIIKIMHHNNYIEANT